MKLDFLIVNYGTASLTLKCVLSIQAISLAFEHEVIVVDNASPDDSVRELRAGLPQSVRLIEAAGNRGFGAGVNLASKYCSGDYLLVLNPDTYFADDSFLQALHYMGDHSQVGIVGLDLKDEDGSRQFSGRTFYSVLNLLARRLPLVLGGFGAGLLARHLMTSAWTTSEPFECHWVMGTGMLIRRSLFDLLAGMDEGYFLYFEDVDLCARAKQAGYRVFAFPGANLVHDHQRASFQAPWKASARIHIKSLFRFARKFGLPLASPNSHFARVLDRDAKF